MNKQTTMVLVFIFITVNLLHAEVRINQTNITTTVEQATLPTAPIYYPWLVHWRIIAIILMFISLIILIAVRWLSKIANLPQVTAWADVEIGQVFISALILVFVITVLGFLDWLMLQFSEYIIDVTGGTESPYAHLCDSINTTCGLQLSVEYVRELEDFGERAVKDIMKSNKVIGEAATTSRGVTSNTIFLGFLGSSYMPNAGKTVLMERNSKLVRYYNMVLGGLGAQEFFLDKLIYIIAPFSIILGIILRSFFVTRRVGGTLIAFGSVLLGVVPLLYMFAWYTYANAAYGGLEGVTLQKANVSCPEECLLTPPKYVVKTNESVYNILNDVELNDTLETIENEGEESVEEIINCSSACEGCSYECRVLPMQPAQCNCNETACANCPMECKIFRNRTDCETGCNCPDFCKADFSDFLNPENNCSTCEGCPTHCRYWYRDPWGNVRPPSEMCNNITACQNCECKVYLPDKNSIDCDYACRDCPEHCRVIYAGGSTEDLLPPDCNSSGCQICPDYCKAMYSAGEGCAEPLPPMERAPWYIDWCYECPASCKMTALFDEDNSTKPNLCTMSPFSEYCGSCSDEIDEIPPICEPYDPDAPAPDNCRACPEEYRVLLRAPDGTVLHPNTFLMPPGCRSGCPESCYSVVDVVVNEMCPPYNSSASSGCEACPYECRLSYPGRGLSCPDACDECDRSCMLNLSTVHVKICMEYNESVPPENCAGCPMACRINNSVTVCDMLNTGNCSDAACPSECKITVNASHYLQETENLGCFGCPLYCRLASGPLPGCPATCYVSSLLPCPEYCKFEPPKKPCDVCLDCHPDCLNKPAFRTDCGEVCGGTNEYLGISMSDLISSGFGAQGRKDTKTLGLLVIPAIVLPVVVIIVVLSFIQKLSYTLGGDIEIPGIGKFL